MVGKFRKCKGQETFNTGRSKCLLDPGKIKGIILAQRGFRLPKSLTQEKIEEMCHADRPNRIYPIKTVVEFAPSGGEANINTTGYGGGKVGPYSAYTAAWTLDEYDATLKSNLMIAKGVEFDSWYVDDNNIIYGTSGNNESLGGIQLSGAYPSGQDFDSSGQEANLIVNTMFKDYEKYIKNADIMECDFDVMEALKGLVFVDLVKVGSGEDDNTYKVVEHYGNLDVTSYYGEALASGSATCFDGGVSAVSYSNDVLTITATGTPKLKSPSILQENGVMGIEQYG